MIKYLIIFLSLASGCSHTHTKIGLPAGPDTILITQEEWDNLNPRMKTIVAHNGASWELWYEKVVSRIQIHDESMD